MRLVRSWLSWFFRLGRFGPYEAFVLGLYFGWVVGVLTVLTILVAGVGVLVLSGIWELTR